MTEQAGVQSRTSAPAYEPSPGEVAGLIEGALVRPGGIDFLVHGDLGAVAAEFHAHAFAVDAARRMLIGERPR